MIKRIVKLTFKSEHIDKFQEIFEQSKEKIAAFEGCHYVELLQQIDDERVFFTYSLWSDPSDLDRYRHSELFKDTWSKTKILFDDRPQAWSLTTRNSSIPDESNT